MIPLHTCKTAGNNLIQHLVLFSAGLSKKNSEEKALFRNSFIPLHTLTTAGNDPIQHLTFFTDWQNILIKLNFVKC